MAIRKLKKVGKVNKKYKEGNEWKSTKVGDAFLSKVTLDNGDSFEVIDFRIGEDRYTIQWNQVVSEDVRNLMNKLGQLDEETRNKILELIDKKLKQ